MLGIAKGSVELIVASQLLVSNETEKSLQCAFNYHATDLSYECTYVYPLLLRTFYATGPRSWQSTFFCVVLQNLSYVTS